MKLLFKTALALYLLSLLWLVLFKFSLNIPEVLDHHSRSLNLIPFAGLRDHFREMIENFVIFVPFGLFLSVNFKQIAMWRKFACIFIFSIVVEAVQFALAIGISDITDVITNTLGGLFGLMIYAFSNRFTNTEKQDRYIVVAGMILLVIGILFRLLVLKVRY